MAIANSATRVSLWYHWRADPVTRYGRPVAVLVPVASARPAKTGGQWLAEMKRLRKGTTLGGTVSIRQLIDAGRKY